MSVHGHGLHAEDDHEYRRAVRDLIYLANTGALAGVAEVIHERRRQIEQLGWTPRHDQEHHADGALAGRASARASMCVLHRAEGTAHPATDQALMAQSGALAAAEIDRLEAL